MAVPSAGASASSASSTASAFSGQAYPKPVYAWFVIGILILASILSFIDRQIVAIVADAMKADLGIGDAQIGLLYGIFAVFYAVAGLPLAYLADRSSRKHIIAAGVLFWSFATMACGLSRSFWQVLAARIGVGVGEATLVPATNSLVSDYFPRDRIPLALSVFQVGAIMGSGLAFIVVGAVLAFTEQRPPPTLPLVGALRPWQLTFLYVGAPGLLVALVMLVIREPVRRAMAPLGAAGAPTQQPGLWEFYRSNRWTFVLHHLGFLSLALMGFAFVFWTVPFFSRVHGMSASSAAQIFGWIFLVFGPLGSVWAGLQAGWFTRRGRKDGNVLAGIAGGALAIPLILAIQVVPSPAWAFMLYGPALFFVNSPFGLAYGSLPVITPPSMRAMVAAIYMFVVSIGMMLGPPLAGLVNERIFPQPDGVRFSLLLVTLVFGAIGIGCLWLCRPHYARSLEAADAAQIEP